MVGRAPVGQDPHGDYRLCRWQDRGVSIYGGGAYHTLNVVDLVGQKPLPDIDTGALNGPHGLAFAGGKVWFTAEGAKAIASYDPAAGKIDWIMGTGQKRTHMIYVTPDLKQICYDQCERGDGEHLGEDAAGTATSADAAGWSRRSAAGTTAAGHGRTSPHGMEPDGRFRWTGR